MYTLVTVYAVMYVTMVAILCHHLWYKLNAWFLKPISSQNFKRYHTSRQYWNIAPGREITCNNFVNEIGSNFITYYRA